MLMLTAFLQAGRGAMGSLVLVCFALVCLRVAPELRTVTLDEIDDSTAEPPALFGRRGEPFNAALDWANTSLARDGCLAYAVADMRDGSIYERTHCHESARPVTSGGPTAASSVFDFATARRPVVDRLRRAPATFTARENTTFSPHSFDPLTAYDSPYSRGAYWQSAGALVHAAEQLEYLADSGKLPGDFYAVARGYRRSVELAAAESARPLDYEKCCFFASDAVLRAQHYLFNTLVYYPRPAVHDGRRALSAAIDWAGVERRFAAGEVVVLDDVLEPWALDAAFRWTLDATCFFEIKRGFLGAYGVDGLTGGLFTQLTRELREALPAAIGASILRQLVSFKYSNAFAAENQQGNRPHGDSSHINCVLWLTPEVHSRDHAVNGLTVWDVALGSREEFERFGPVLESITGRRPAWDIFKPLYLAQFELVFHDS